MDREVFDAAYAAIEPLIFSDHDLINRVFLTNAELVKISIETNAAIDVILKGFGVTFDELEKELTKIADEMSCG